MDPPAERSRYALGLRQYLQLILVRTSFSSAWPFKSPGPPFHYSMERPGLFESPDPEPFWQNRVSGSELLSESRIA